MATPNDYHRWIQENVTGDPTGLCAEVTQQMVQAFPELRRVRGHYTCALTGKSYPHWWLETESHDVIDPTADQFPSRGRGVYEEHVGPEPTGKCPNCGGYAYDGKTVCSDKCGDEYVAYLMGT